MYGWRVVADGHDSTLWTHQARVVSELSVPGDEPSRALSLLAPVLQSMSIWALFYPVSCPSVCLSARDVHLLPLSLYAFSPHTLNEVYTSIYTSIY